MSCKTCHWSQWNGTGLRCVLFNKEARLPCVKWTRATGGDDA